MCFHGPGRARGGLRRDIDGMGDNASRTADVASVVSKIDALLRSLYRRSASRDGALARLVRAYRGRRSASGGLVADVAELRTELAIVRERHGEQIDRLEELAGELVRAVETLRESISASGRDS